MSRKRRIDPEYKIEYRTLDNGKVHWTLRLKSDKIVTNNVAQNVGKAEKAAHHALRQHQGEERRK